MQQRLTVAAEHDRPVAESVQVVDDLAGKIRLDHVVGLVDEVIHAAEDAAAVAVARKFHLSVDGPRRNAPLRPLRHPVGVIHQFLPVELGIEQYLPLRT